MAVAVAQRQRANGRRAPLEILGAEHLVSFSDSRHNDEKDANLQCSKPAGDVTIYTTENNRPARIEVDTHAHCILRVCVLMALATTSIAKYVL
jgi:hypothetical protein